MLVNNKNTNILTAHVGEGKPKLILVPGINVLDDDVWKAAEPTLAEHIKRGVVIPIYKVSKTKGKDGKEIESKSPVSPDEIPNEKLDDIVNEIQSEAQAEKFMEKSTKESVRAKTANRKNKIAEETKAMDEKK